MSDILEHLPDYYDGVLEMHEIMNSDGIELDKLNLKVERMVLNLYIMQADSDGLRILENAYSIPYDPDLTLEQRRNNLIMKLLPPRPITLRYFKQIIKIVSIKADINVDAVASTYVAYLDTATSTQQQAEQLNELMQVYLPANLANKIYRLSHYDSTVNNFIGTANNLLVNSYSKCNDDIFKLKSNLNEYIGTASRLKVRAVSFCRDVI